MLPIVVVDDSREDLLLAERVLRQCKIRNPIRTLSNGREAMAYFEKGVHGGEDRLPCLLLLDLMMAPVDGLKVLAFLQEKKFVQSSPVVMVSGLTDIKAIQQGYQLGARTFLVKPINREDILQMLNSLKGISIVKSPEGYTLSLQTAASMVRNADADRGIKIPISL